MKYFNFGFIAISKKLLFSIFMIIEIAALLVITNVTVANFNSKNMLIEPYQEILNKGASIYQLNLTGVLYTSEDFTTFYSDMKSFKEADVILEYEMPVDIAVSSTTVYALDDDVFRKYHMPLKSGSYTSELKSSDGYTLAYISPDLGYNVGDIIETDYGSFKVQGILFDITYLPYYSGYDINDKDIRMMYEKVDYSVPVQYVEVFGEMIAQNTHSAIIVAQGGLTSEILSCYALSEAIFLAYNNDISAEAKDYNDSIIEKYEEMNSNSIYCLENEELINNTNEYLNETYVKMLPIIICVAVVVIIGLIGSIAINTRNQIRNYSIYFLCGSRWNDCIKIAFANIGIHMIVAAIISVSVLYLMNVLNFNYLIGQSYRFNNILISAGLLIFMILLSMVLPMFIIKNTSPVETIKENEK